MTGELNVFWNNFELDSGKKFQNGLWIQILGDGIRLANKYIDGEYIK